MPGDQPKDSGGTKDRVQELVQLVIAYAKQEALEPITAQLKAMLRGIGGALLVALGTVLLAIGFVRALQAELGSTSPSGALIEYAPVTGAVHFGRQNAYGFGHHLAGNWSWVPYMGGALFGVVVAVICVTRIRGGAAK